MVKGHHCKVCGKSCRTQCIKKGHLVQCEVAGCGHCFQALSGCHIHAYNAGYNQLAKKFLAGSIVDVEAMNKHQKEAAERTKLAQEEDDEEEEEEVERAERNEIAERDSTVQLANTAKQSKCSAPKDIGPEGGFNQNGLSKTKFEGFYSKKDKVEAWNKAENKAQQRRSCTGGTCCKKTEE